MSSETLPAGDKRESASTSRRGWRRWVVVAMLTGVVVLAWWRREIGLSVLGRWHHWRTGAPGVSVEDGRAIIERGGLLIDVRESEEYRVSHARGAVNVPIDDVLRHGLPDQYVGRTPIVVYCTIGRRSGIVARRLSSEGVEAYNLVGGILEIAEEAPSWIDAPSVGRRVHVWSDEYAWLLPPAFSAVTFSGAGE